MKINKITKIAILRVKQNKKRNMMLMIPLTIILILLFMANMVQYSMEKYVESMEDNIELRTIGGVNYNASQYSEIVEKINKLEHVQMVTSELERHVFATISCEQLSNSGDGGNIEIKPTNSQACPEVIKGRKINENDTYSIIIPSKINTDTKLGTLEYRNIEEKYIDGEKFINKEVEVFFQTNRRNYIKTFRVVGIYDSDRYADTRSIYTPTIAIREINEEIGQEERYFQLEIVVDKAENVKKIENKLYEEGIIKKSNIQEEATLGGATIGTTEEVNFSSLTHISVETQKIIQKLILFLILSSLVILVVMIIVTNTNKTYLSKTELGILKVEGYTNKDIQKIAIIENIIICVISIIVSLICLGIIRLVADTAINYIIETETIGITMSKLREQIFYIKKVPQRISVLFMVIISLIIILIEVLNTYFNNKKILSKNIAEILEND